MAIRKNKMICICNGVTENEILRILKRGARDLGDVRNFTLASTSCGRCKSEVEAIVDHYASCHKSDLQQNIKFQ